MRTITDHKLNGLNEAIKITALDQPGPGGANHDYRISYGTTDGSLPFISSVKEIRFQNGPINEAGVNGISNEALLAILIDRMRGFQHGRKAPIGLQRTDDSSVMTDTNTDFDFNTRGKYASRENACALTHLEEALMWLQKRTRDRLARGVEGTYAK